MPTENEVKYVLKLGCEDEIIEGVKLFNYGTLYDALAFVKQHYIADAKSGYTIRVREFSRCHPPSRSILYDESFVDYFFTCKTVIKGRPIEIENKIYKRDYDDLATRSIRSVRKRRYYFSNYFRVVSLNSGITNSYEENEKWSIDFIYDENYKTYFVLAECEIAEGLSSPRGGIPDFIQKNILHTATKEDYHKFTNWNLADIGKAKKLLKNLEKK